jgi:DNA-binding transcriptional LysR family regulator
MTIQQCRYVIEIAKTGSFSEAAKQLFIAQSSLSVSIKMLEQELDIKIFERSSNGVYLTEDGSEFVKYATQIVDGEDFAINRYKNEKISSKLRIATQHYDFIADIFGNYLKSVSAECYKFSIREIETYNVIQEVETGISDIGIIAIKDGDFDVMNRYLCKKGIVFTELLKVSPHVFFRKGHPLACSKSLEYCDLQGFPYVSYEQGDHNSSYFTEEMLEAFNAKKHIEISDRATLMNLLLITDSYTIGTGIMPSALNNGDIVSIPLQSEDFYIIGYLLNDMRKLSEMSSAFIEKLNSSIKNITNITTAKKGDHQ